VLPPYRLTELVWGFRRARGAHHHALQDNVVVAHTIGIDTGKNTLHMVGLDGAIVLREKISRSQIAARLVNVPPCLIGS
jgi:hypothetical protein